MNDVTRRTVGANENLRRDLSTGQAGRHDTLRLRLGTGHRRYNSGALATYVPDPLSAPQELVGEHEVVTKGIALCAKIQKVALGVDGNQADRSQPASSPDDEPKSRTNYTNRQRQQRDQRAQQAEPLHH